MLLYVPLHWQETVGRVCRPILKFRPNRYCSFQHRSLHVLAAICNKLTLVAVQMNESRYAFADRELLAAGAILNDGANDIRE
jgi:hypothetical protein